MVKIPFIDKSSSAIISSYRRLISLSKILSCLGILLTLYLIYINFNPVNNNLELIENNSRDSSFNSNDKTNYEIKILNSTFKGLNKNLNPYQIQAVQAFRTLNNKYALEKINATYKINDNKVLVINAKNGILNENSHMLKLTNDVQFFLGESILKTQEAQLNLLNKEAFSKTGVTLSYKNCQITSNKFSSTNDNNTINFKGSVSTIIDVSDF
ncbi:MAG: LPS export ABC transporter periplasmic protein LptC [Rickettsia endosymbiont of Pseudomimeciton antennatum]|nr:LPS export ABC transporter periplasmic protein LptC [Rickettsia endosymbiont of Pseudomimeciton antennatum]MCC8397742.1 LPS export ABC transporter periplasmic protein LptC [Rickettsia endosymbiont of Labidopullus appendiculatus]